MALTLALASVPTAGWAQSRGEPTLADKETARQAFYEGQDAFNAGDLVGALKAFRAADAIMGVPSTRLEVGRTLMQMSRLLEAAEMLASVDLIGAAEDENDVQKDARDEATGLLEKVRARIPTLLVTIRGLAPGTSVSMTIDGDSIPAGALDYPRKVDPGAHVVRIEAPGYETKAEKVEVAEREEKRIRLDLVATPGTDLLPRPEHSESVPEDGEGFSLPAWGWAGFGLGGAGILVGGITGVMTLSTVGQLEDDCGPDKACPPGQRDKIDDATTVAHVSTAGFVVGGVGIAGGVAAVIVALSEDDEAPTESPEVSVRPWIGRAGFGLAGRF